MLMVKKNETDQLFENESIPIEYFVNTSGPFSLFQDLLSLAKVIKQHNIQIVHSHHRYCDLLANLLRPLFGFRTITTVHSIVKGKRLLSYKSEVLLAVSNAVKEHLVSCYSIRAEKIFVLKNGIDPSQYTIPVKEADQKKIFTLGFIGRFSKEKGIDILLSALRDLVAEKFEFRIIIAGDGEQESDVKQFQTEFTAHCEFRGSVKDISSVYSEIDLLLLPSRVDPFPYALLESGLFRVPVIASDVDGIAELIENKKNGWLITAGSVVALKEAIVQAANSIEEMKNWAANLHDKVISEYTINRHIAKLTDIYNRVLRKK